MIFYIRGVSKSTGWLWGLSTAVSIFIHMMRLMLTQPRTTINNGSDFLRTGKPQGIWLLQECLWDRISMPTFFWLTRMKYYWGKKLSVRKKNHSPIHQYGAFWLQERRIHLANKLGWNEVGLRPCNFVDHTLTVRSKREWDPRKRQLAGTHVTPPPLPPWRKHPFLWRVKA